VQQRAVTRGHSCDLLRCPLYKRWANVLQDRPCRDQIKISIREWEFDRGGLANVDVRIGAPGERKRFAINVNRRMVFRVLGKGH
jgi:hypothetical protein